MEIGLYGIVEVKTDMANRLERCRTSDATLASLREMQATRQKSLDTARQKMDAMLAAKRKLEVDVENLDARLKAVQLASAVSENAIDDSALAHCREVINDLRTRLNVAEKMANAQSPSEIQLDAPAHADIAHEVEEYLGGDKVARTK